MNLLEANKKRDKHLSNIRNLGVILCILTGFIGCCVIKDGGSSFGWTFSAIGFVLCCYMNYQKYQLKLGGGALTKRKLVEEDLEGLSKQELERLRCHIYALHGYKFNVNDGLCYLEKIAASLIVEEKQDVIEYKTDIKCSKHQFIMARNGYNKLRSQNGHIIHMTEKDKDLLRESIDRTSEIGCFNHNGEYGHEGRYYYYFRNCDWYKPTTNNLEEVYAKMSDIEKTNVELIKTQEAKCL